MKNDNVELPLRLELLLVLVALVISAIVAFAGYGILTSVMNSAFESLLSSLPNAAPPHVMSTSAVWPLLPIGWLLIWVQLYRTIRKKVVRSLHSLLD